MEATTPKLKQVILIQPVAVGKDFTVPEGYTFREFTQGIESDKVVFYAMLAKDPTPEERAAVAEAQREAAKTAKFARKK